MITCDVRGLVGFIPAYLTYPQHVSEFVRYIAQARAGLADADLDLTSFSTLASEDPYPITYYTGTTETTCLAVMRELLDASGSYMYFSGAGKLVVGQMRFRTAALSVNQSFGQGLIVRIRKIANPMTLWELKLGYGVSWTVQDNATLAGAARETAHADLVSEKRRYVTDDLGSKVSPMSRTETHETFYQSATDAAAEATRRLGFWDSTFGLYEIELAEVQFLITVGTTVKITYGRFGFESGLDLFVLGVAENASTRRTIIQAFG